MYTPHILLPQVTKVITILRLNYYLSSSNVTNLSFWEKPKEVNSYPIKIPFAKTPSSKIFPN